MADTNEKLVLAGRCTPRLVTGTGAGRGRREMSDKCTVSKNEVERLRKLESENAKLREDVVALRMVLESIALEPIANGASYTCRLCLCSDKERGCHTADCILATT